VSTSRDDLTARVARLQIKHGITPDRVALERHILAKQIGPDLFELDGKWLSGEEVQAAAEEQYAKGHEFDDVKHDLDLDRPVEGEDVHAAAVKYLEGRGIYEPSAEQYLEAIERVTP
jgi:hypothetical protein